MKRARALPSRQDAKHHQPGTVRTARGKRPLILGLCLLLAFAASWAVFELVVWNRIPMDLVGKWVVEGGPQDGATFDFARNGTLDARLNNKGMEQIMKATVAVQGQTLFVTTRNPHTQKDETRPCALRQLTPTSLVVEFDNGEAYRMSRAR